MSVSFTYRPTKFGFIVTGAVVALAMSFLVIFGISPNKPQANDFGGESYPATLLAMANGCGETYRIPPVEGQYGVIPSEYWELNEDPGQNIPTHLMTVPVFGYMAETGLNDDQIKFYSPAEAQQNEVLNRQTILRSMYDRDLTVVWYSPEINPLDLDALRVYIDESNEEIIAYPWYFNGGKLVGNRDVAFAKWGISQTCSLYSDDVLTEFIQFGKDNPVTKLPNIPDAPMTKEGRLLPIGGYGQ